MHLQLQQQVQGVEMVLHRSHLKSSKHLHQKVHTTHLSLRCKQGIGHQGADHRRQDYHLLEAPLRLDLSQPNHQSMHRILQHRSCPQA